MCFLRDAFAIHLNKADGSRMNLQNSLYGDKSLRIQKSSANQDISGFCEVQRLTVKIIQCVLSKYFNIVFLEPLYENKQVLVALIYNYSKRDHFSINLLIVLVIYFIRRLPDYGSRALRHIYYLVIIWRLMILVLFHFFIFNIGGPNAGLRSNSVKSRLLLWKLGDHLSPHTEAAHNTRYLPSSAPHILFDIEPSTDKSPSLSEAVVIEEVQKKLPSLSIAYWNCHKNRHVFYKNESCAKFPSVFDLDFSNITGKLSIDPMAHFSALVSITMFDKPAS
jgi:hypothetical protein